MSGPGSVDPNAYERQVSAALDRDFAASSAEARDFLQRTRALRGWQPASPQMFLGFADRLGRWADHFRGYGPRAAWLEKAGRPAVARRLAAIVGELEGAVRLYREMAGQGAAHRREMHDLTMKSSRETAAAWAKMNEDRKAAFSGKKPDPEGRR